MIECRIEQNVDLILTGMDIERRKRGRVYLFDLCTWSEGQVGQCFSPGTSLLTGLG